MTKVDLASGSFNSLTRVQQERLNAIRKELRHNRDKYEKFLPPDPDHVEDCRGNPYWASEQHLWEALIHSLEVITNLTPSKKSDRVDTYEQP